MMAKAKPPIDQRRAIAKELRALFPITFDPKFPMPLEKGVHQDVATTLGVSIKQSRAFLRWWTGRKPYLRIITRDSHRYNLRGVAGEPITDKDRADAQRRLEALRRTK